MRRRFSHIAFLVLVSSLLFHSCKSTHFVPDDKHMLSKNVVKIKKTPSLSADEIALYIKQKPNESIFLGLWKFYLTAYNFLHRKKDDTEEFQNKKHGFLTRFRLKSKEAIGEAPVLLDTTKIPYSIKQIQTYLKNKGYYHSYVSHDIRYRRKKAKVVYTVVPNKPFVINEIKTSIKDPLVLSIYNTYAQRSPVQKGKIFNGEFLNTERLQLTELYKNEGMFDFNEYFVHYKVDTTIGDHKVNLTLVIDDPMIKFVGVDSLIPSKHKQYSIKNIYIQTDFKPNNPSLLFTDTICIDNMYQFLYLKKMKYKPTPIVKAVFFKTNELYRVKNHNITYSKLTELGMFNFIKIEYKKNQSDTFPSLNTYIKLSSKKKNTISLEGQATFREGFGGGGILVYKTRNPFRGSEQLEIKLRAFAENIKNTTTNEKYQGTDIGPQISYKIPSLLFFPKLSKKLWREAYPKTVLSTYFNFQNRAEYKRWVYSISNTYEMSESSWKIHKFSIPDLSISHIDENSSILKSLNTLSPRLAYSFQNYLNAGMKYSYIFNGQLKNESHPSVLMTNASIVGLIGSLLNYTGIFAADSSGAQLLAGIKYSKFIKIDADFRKYLKFKKENQIVLRSYAGFAIPYGKGNIAIPFDKLFYTGGANGIRGWKVRTLGPGSSTDSTNIDKLGDIKLELNAEYRFKITSIIKAAVFADMGNIWQLKESNSAAVFKVNKFYKEIAVAAGLGLRFDFTFLIVRLDVAYPIKTPQKINTWQFHIKEPEYNLGIGYPF